MRQVAHELGLALKVPRDILNAIKDEKKPLNRLIRVIGEFLSCDNPKPTWRAIVEALQSPLVRHHKLAKKIEKKFCTVVEGNLVVKRCAYDGTFIVFFFPEAHEEDDFVIPDKSVVRFTGTTIGQGTFGEVLEVVYQGSKRCAAKKYTNVDEADLLNKFGERCILCRTRHPNIVAYYGVCKLATSTVVAMERMSLNLGMFLEEGRVSQVQKYQILHEVVQGLNFLHTHKPAIIHGHLHEKNVLLNSRGVAKIVDFGNSDMLKPRLTSTAHASLEYLSPEALEGSDPDDKMDIFALGHLSIYIINQHRPHPLKRHNYRNDQGDLIARTEVQRRKVYLDQVKPQLDGGEMHPLYSIIIRCLTDEASERPSCEDILQTRVFPARK